MSYDKLDLDFIAETYSDPQWEIHEIAEKLDLSERQIQRIAREVLDISRPVKWLTDAEKQFIDAVYEDPNWTMSEIVERLGVKRPTIVGYARAKGLRRPKSAINRPSHNWRLIWESVTASSMRHAEKETGVKYGAIQYAMRRMREMTPEEREARWQEWGFR